MIATTPIQSRDPITGLPVRQFSFLGNGGLRLAATCREPDGDPRAAVAFAHGFTAFMDAYLNVLRALVDAGFVVYAVDHRGHGYSEGKRASLDRIDDMVEDFERLVEIARAEHRELPLFTLGHSLGGLVVARHGLRFPEGLAGMIPVSAAFIVGEHVSDLTVKMLIGASKLAPQLPAIDAEMAVPRSNDSEPASRKRRFLSYNGRIRLNMARELYLGGQDVLNRAATIRVPVLIQHGTDDQVTMPRGSELMFEELSSPDRTLELWTGRQHNLITDEGWEEPVGSIAEWMGQRG